MIDIDKPQEKDIKYIADNMRPLDQFECRAFNQEPYDALKQSVDMSGWSMVGRVNGRPIFITGYVSLGQRAAVWLLGTDEINNNAKSFYQLSRDVIDWLLKRFVCLSNRVCLEHKESVAWLTRLGAEWHGEKSVINGKEFQFFDIRRDKQCVRQ